MTKKEYSLRWAMAVVFAIVCFTFFHWFYPNHLFLKEQMRIFLYTGDYFFSFWDEPAWFSCYVGNFLTQFYYLKVVGPLIVTLVLLSLWYVSMLVLRKFGGGNIVAVYAMLPVALEWGLLCRLTYNISTTLSLIFVLLIFLGYLKILDKRWSMVVAFLLLPVIYGLVGSRLFIFSLLIIFYEGAKNRKCWWFWFSLLVTSYLYPYFVRHFYGLTVEDAYKYSYVDGFSVYFPAVLLILEIFALHVKFIRRIRLNRQTLFTAVFILFVLFGGVILNTNRKREKILALDRAVYLGDWDRVISLSEKYDFSDLLVSYYRNIAWANKDQLPERLLSYEQYGTNSLFLPVSSISSMLPVFFSNEVYYQIGDKDMARRRAIQGILFTPKQRSGRMVKRLVEIDLETGNTVEALRYLDLLDATLFYRGWANEQRARLVSPVNTGNYYLPRKKDWEQVPGVMPIAFDYPAQLDTLVKHHPDNKKALDYLLCYYLLGKKLDAFKSAYDTYYKDHFATVPRLYEDALLKWHVLMSNTNDQVIEYQFPAHIVKEYNEYQRLKMVNKTKEEMRDRYSSRYWFYFDYSGNNH